MNILIIGNGFDLAHKLPTKYTDFLDFLGNVRVLKEIHPEERKRLIRKIDKDMKQYLFTDENNFNINSKRSVYIDEIYQLLKDNIWINWLYQRRADNEILGEYWVDFETEISGVIQSIEQLSPILSESSGVFNLIGIQAKVFTFFIKKYYTEHKSQDATMKYLKERLLLDLNKLIRCFEIYLEDFVKNIDKRLLSLDIYNLKVDKVLTFNYTNTYLKLYNDDVECDYIHGKADINNTMVTNNMVLGIDDYLNEDEKFTNTNFIEFKKYYQRLIKGTNCDYKKWIDEINHTNYIIKHNIYIFGHSLASTDRDVLLDFIENEKTIITLFVAITTSGYIDNNLTDQMLNMAKDLYGSTKNETYSPSEFKRVGNSPQRYQKIISNFMDLVNTYNADKKAKSYHISDSDSCEKIFSLLEAGIKIDEQQAISLIEDIIKGSNHSYGSDEEMWRCVLLLRYYVNPEKLIEIISNHISGDNNLYRIKYTYLLNLLKEKGYFDNIY